MTSSYFLKWNWSWKDAGSIPLRRFRPNRRKCLTLWQKRTFRKRSKNGGDGGTGVYIREGTTSRVTAADRPYGKFYDFDSVSLETFGSTHVLLNKIYQEYFWKSAIFEGRIVGKLTSIWELWISHSGIGEVTHLVGLASNCRCFGGTYCLQEDSCCASSPSRCWKYTSPTCRELQLTQRSVSEDLVLWWHDRRLGKWWLRLVVLYMEMSEERIQCRALIGRCWTIRWGKQVKNTTINIWLYYIY